MSAELSELGDRFELGRRLGSGATGTVYRAYDKARKATVAVKVLSRADPASLYRFKSEFRALTGIVHPNLVQLYDLLSRDGEWLLTMELVEGRDFLRFVRAQQVLAVRSADGEESVEDLDGETLGTLEFEAQLQRISLPSEGANDSVSPQRSRHGSRPEQASLANAGGLDEKRLRSALRQLAEGLAALHREQRLHRDLKPANVLVFTRDERLVICDFGLVTESARTDGTGEGEGGVAGTLAYMAPEQATGGVLTEATDWYAVGVMLYQALTGVLPYSPRLRLTELVRAKVAGQVVHPSSIAAEAPEDLGDLAVALLAGNPEERPRYAEIVALLEGERKRPSLGPSAPHQFIGRSAQKAQLTTALARARAGSATVALVCGPSGMGKSALVSHFLDEARTRERALVLAGRCYEREELPFKAFDPLMDALSVHLLTLDEMLLAELLPPNIGALARLFPVLRRVSAVAISADQGQTHDVLEERRRALSALRELFRRLAVQRPLIVYIDDLQWGDLDSGPLFSELLHAPYPPPLLMVCAYRLEDVEQSPLLKALRKTHLPESGITPVEVRVEALSMAESRELALSLLGDAPEPRAVAERIALEAGGSPFFVRELAHHTHAHGGVVSGDLSLETLIARRLERLPPDSRALFDLIATAGRPERRSLFATASQLGENYLGALRVLEAQKLVHSSGSTADDPIEVYHDRLRETAYAQLAQPVRQRLHRALADAMMHSVQRDPEALFEHHARGGDESHLAGQYALEAARNAEDQLAFDRAARLYGAALSLAHGRIEQRRELEERRAHCLSLAGRGVEAAEAYTRALVGASPAQAMQLRSLATTQLIRAGRIAQAFAELKSARAIVGLKVPESSLSALFMLLWRRVKIRMSRLGLRRSDQPPSPELVQRADMLWGIGATMVGLDSLRGAIYQAEHLLVALRANEPYRLARALAVEAIVSATRNDRPARTQFLLDRGLELGGMSGHPHALSAVKGSAGICRLLEGRFREAVSLTREAQGVIRERLNATLAWDNVQMVLFELQATAYLGDVRTIAERVPETLRDAEARGDLYAATSCRTRRCVWAWLGPDDPEHARRQVELAESQWLQSGYHYLHWYATWARAEVDLYCDTPSPSLERLTREWPRLALLRKIQYTRIEVWYLRARLRLAAARQRFEGHLLSSARDDARAILREGTHWGFALGRLVLACAASIDDPPRALRLLAELEGQFDALDMRLHHEVARYRRGQLMGDTAGHALVDAAQAAMRALGVARPEGFVALLAPGFPGTPARARVSGLRASLTSDGALPFRGSSVDRSVTTVKASATEMRP